MAVGITGGSRMVKVTLRKATKHQTPVEKLLSLEQNRVLNRNRVHFLNRRENVHLAVRYHGYEQQNSKRMRDILRTKDQMKLNLIELDYSRRKAKTSCEFENRLREGRTSPVFIKEHQKLMQKEEELVFLQNRLSGPNSQMIVNHLHDELMAINCRVEVSSSSQQCMEQKVVNSYVQSKKSEYVKVQTMDARYVEDATQDIVQRLDGDSEERERDGAVAEYTQHDREHFGFEVDQMVTEEHVNQEINSKLSHRAAAGQVPLLSMRDSFFPNTSSLSQRTGELPPLKFTTRQKHCQFVVHRSHHPRQSPLNPTHSARKRIKHAQKRVSDLTEKTKVDMKKGEAIRRRKDIDTPRDSLKGIQQAERITRLKVAKKGITLPDIKSNLMSNRQTQRARTVDSSIILPSLKVDRDLFSELKRQRFKHKDQSDSFPKLR